MAEMTAEEAVEWGKTLDFPTVWAYLTKVGERVDKAAETVDKMGLKVDKTAEMVDKMVLKFDETADMVKRLSKNVGGLNVSMGELVETLFAPHLWEKFEKWNYGLKRSFKRVPIYDDKIRLLSDIDILLSNTTVCMAVEVKRWLEKKDHVDEHIKRMGLIRKYPPAEVKGKILLGAIVGAVVTAEAREYAEENGLFVLELTGEDVSLLEPPEGFKPKEW